MKRLLIFLGRALAGGIYWLVGGRRGRDDDGPYMGPFG